MPTEVRDYTFMGWMAHGDPKVATYIVDREGRIVGGLEPGDSFITMEVDQFEPGEPFVMPGPARGEG